MKELTLHATLENMDTALLFVDEEMERMECPMKVQMQMDIAVDELLSNIMRYAYVNGDGEAVLQIYMSTDPRMVCINFIDSGIPYNPLDKEDPDIGLPAEQRKIGGLGIYMVKQTMDHISYEHKDGKNILRIKKIF